MASPSNGHNYVIVGNKSLMPATQTGNLSAPPAPILAVAPTWGAPLGTVVEEPVAATGASPSVAGPGAVSTSAVTALPTNALNALADIAQQFCGGSGGGSGSSPFQVPDPTTTANVDPNSSAAGPTVLQVNGHHC